MKRLSLVLAVLAVAATFAAGCGGGGESGPTELASVAPADAPVFLDLTIQPQGRMKNNLENLALTVGAVRDPGERLMFEIERMISEHGEPFRFEKDVLPWLGGEAGLFLENYSGEEFEGYGAAIQVTDEEKAREFVDKQLEAGDETSKDGSYEGVDFKVQAEDGTTIGVFDDLVVFAEDEAIFKSMVDASNGESLGEAEAYAKATEKLPSESEANVYVDIGRLIKEAGKGIDAETKLFLDSIGVEPNEATAVASLVPGHQLVELVVSSNISGENPPSGDASELLDSFPANSLAAFASTEFGKRFEEGIDQLNERGISGQVPPHTLKKGLKEAGIDLESIAGSIGDVGGYVVGHNQRNLRGALVLNTDTPQQAKNTVSNIGLFLRSAGTPGVTAVNGAVSGFSIRSPELGPRPIVIVAKGSRIAIGYGLAAALSAFKPAAETLAEFAPYRAAGEVLGKTPISVFVNGPEALELAISMGLVKHEFGKGHPWPYLHKISYLALGAEASGDRTTARLIVGLSYEAVE
ncbi:MAG TPA: DUF3352 domain-containing protein [Solirubrobacterales bacterium]